MISTLMLGLAASKAATASVTTLLEVLSQVASFRVTDSGAAAVEVLAALEAAAELLGAEAPQPASIMPTMEAASSMEMLFFIIRSPYFFGAACAVPFDDFIAFLFSVCVNAENPTILILFSQALRRK